MRTYLLPALSFVSLLIGCASANTESDRAAVHMAKPCCVDSTSLPLPSPAARVNKLRFDADSPHYDFGLGIGPFARFTIDPKSAKRLGLVSIGKGSSPLLGGDGYQHYADLDVVFFDANGVRLPPARVTEPFITPKPREFSDTALFAMTRWAEVPEAAVLAVVVSNAKRLGKHDSARGTAPDSGVVVGRLYLPIQGGDRTFTYTHTLYGNAYLLVDGGAPQ